MKGQKERNDQNNKFLKEYFVGRGKCCYQDKDAVEKQVMEVLKHYQDLNISSSQSQKQFLCITGSIPLVYKSKINYVSIKIELPENFPTSPPSVQILKMIGLELNRHNKFVSNDGKVQIPYLQNWSKNGSDLKSLCQNILDEFSQQPPVQPPSPRSPIPARKLAFIVGINKYKNLPPLANSVRDAQLIDQTVKKLGFQTTVLYDCELEVFKSEFRKFSENLKDNDIILFYFSGHGAQQSQDNIQDNYLFAVDSKPEHDPNTNKIILRGVKLNKHIMRDFHYLNSIFLIILDACRVYPNEKEVYKCVKNLPQELQNRTLGNFQGNFQLNFQLPENIGKGQYDIVFACQPGSIAVENVKLGVSYLTDALNKSLQENEYWNDALIDAKNKVYKDSQGRQIPSVVSNLRFKLNLAKVTKQETEL